MVDRGLVQSRSHAARLIKLNKVIVGAMVARKPGQLVYPQNSIEIKDQEDYVSRSGYKLAGAVHAMGVSFKNKVVLDVGSSTGGFTDFSLKNGAKKVYAVDVGTNQLHPSLRADERIELHEQTDIRDVGLEQKPYDDKKPKVLLKGSPNIVVIDVSFISLKDILPHVSCLMSHDSLALAMVKPQFEAGKDQVNKGVIKNDRVRREILKDFETWSKKYFIIKNQADSEVAGTKGNLERFYLLQKLS